MDEQALKELLLKTFLGEARENLQVVEQSLETLRGGLDALGEAGLADLYRRVHSMKGAAGTVGIRHVQQLCHSMEGLLKGVQKGNVRVDDTFLDVFNTSVDLVTACVEAGGDQGVDPVAALAAEAALQDLEQTHTQDVAAVSVGSTDSLESLDGSLDTASLDLSTIEAEILAAAGDSDADDSTVAPPFETLPDSPGIGAPPPTPPTAPLITADLPAPGADSDLAALTDTSALLAAISEPEPSTARTSANIASPMTSVTRVSGATTTDGSSTRGRRSRVDEVLRVPVTRVEALSQQAEILRDLPIRGAHAVESTRALVAELDELERNYGANVDFLAGLIGELELESDQVRMRRFLDREKQHLQVMRAGVKSLLESLSENVFQSKSGTEALLDALHDIRVMPLRDIAFPMVRMVRETARGLGKRARLTLEGVDLVLDKAILDRLATPLDHILRNAVDHGLETPDERSELGKPAEGTIRLSASLDEGHAVVQIEDDGRGIDPEGIRAKAVRHGLLSLQVARQLSDDDATRLIFEHGFSTREEATHLSGRGLGLDIVREAVESMGGRIEVYSTVGQGSTFRLVLPLRIASARGITIATSDEYYVLPLLSVERAIFTRDVELVQVGDHSEMNLDGENLPISDLGKLISAPDSGLAAHEKAVVVLRSFDRKAAFLVDRIVGAQDYVQRHPGQVAMALDFVAGATVLQDGSLAVVLDPSALVRAATGRGAAWKPEVRGEESAAPTILVADDSITSRTLERHILESAGYQVLVAEDGLEALEHLEDNYVDLVVSDVEMPRCDGIEFVTRMRENPRFQDIPVILVTSLGSDEDRQRGMDAGADAYIVKSVFDQKKLLAAVERYL